MTLAPPVQAVFPTFPDLQGKVALITGMLDRDAMVLVSKVQRGTSC